MEVRPATREDVAGVQHVGRAAWHAAHEPIVGAEAVDEFLEKYYERERLRGRVTGDVDLFYVAVDEAVVGFAAARPVDEGPGVYGLGNCYVHPDRWGEGVGSRLLNRTEQAVRSDGGNRLRLAVMADSERAIGFYESGGYERVSEGYDERLDVRRCVYAKDL